MEDVFDKDSLNRISVISDISPFIQKTYVTLYGSMNNHSLSTGALAFLNPFLRGTVKSDKLFTNLCVRFSMNVLGAN